MLSLAVPVSEKLTVKGWLRYWPARVSWKVPGVGPACDAFLEVAVTLTVVGGMLRAKEPLVPVRSLLVIAVVVRPRERTCNTLLRSEEHTSELQSLRHLVC